MQVFVKSDVTRTVEVAAGATVATVKAQIVAATGLLGAGARLVFAGRNLDDARTLASYDVQKESTLHLCVGLCGGAKKRKKKTYTKPKKNKHKRRKVKLAFLQFYKVDDGGKVTRLRKECPSPECGPGTFMANHWDRHYCGKCGLTYVYSKEEMKARGAAKPKAAAKVEVVAAAAPAGKGKKGKK